jgi:inosose dehydratase
VGGEVLVLAASSGRKTYDEGVRLEGAEWSALGRALAAAEALASRHGLALAVHPHYGTVIEGAAQVRRLLEVSSVGLCLDVGHLMVAGADAVEVARLAAGRVRHVHLKDVDAATARRVQAGELGYHEAVRAGLYRPLGQGAGRIGDLVRLLEASGYRGWYVLEQDVVLAGNPPLGRGPVEDAGRSLDFLRALAA